MIRDSLCVKFTLSFSFGPASGSVGGRPPSFLPVAASRSCRRFSFSSYSAHSASWRSCARSLIFSCASRIAASRFSRRSNSSGISNSCCSYSASWSARSASFSSFCTSPCNCRSSLLAYPQLIALCLLAFPLHRAPVQAHSPHPQRSQGCRHLQNLLEQPFQLSQKSLAKARYRVMVRMLVSGDVAKRHRVVGGLLQLAAGEYPGGVAVEQQRYQQGRMIGSLAATTGISTRYLTEIELLYNYPLQNAPMLFR